METQKGPYKDYSPSKRGLIWVSMLVWGSVEFWVLGFGSRVCPKVFLRIQVANAPDAKHPVGLYYSIGFRV